MPEPQPDGTQSSGGLGALRQARQERTRRQVPPSRHPRQTEPAPEPAEAAEDTGQQPAPPVEDDDPPKSARRRQPDPDRRRRNIAMKQLQDASTTWAAQMAKATSRAEAIAEAAAAAADAGAGRDWMAQVVTEAAERHHVDTSTLPTDVARAAGLRRRRRSNA